MKINDQKIKAQLFGGLHDLKTAHIHLESGQFEPKTTLQYTRGRLDCMVKHLKWASEYVTESNEAVQ